MARRDTNLNSSSNSIDHEFSVLDATDTEQYGRWLDQWHKWPDQEVFAHPDYVRLFAGPQDSVKCAVLAADSCTVLYPFILRKLPTDQYPSLSQPAADITSPYGYGGAYLSGSADSHDLSTEFWKHFETWARDNRVVSEFVRFGLFQDALIPYPGERVARSTNIVRPLDCSEAEIWMDYEHKVRKNVKRAQRANLTVQVDATGERLEEFLAIYTGTMDRRSASENYYFSNEFFEQLNRTLAGSFAYF